jgi:hypothetical protein
MEKVPATGIRATADTIEFKFELGERLCDVTVGRIIRGDAFVNGEPVGVRLAARVVTNDENYFELSLSDLPQSIREKNVWVLMAVLAWIDGKRICEEAELCDVCSEVASMSSSGEGYRCSDCGSAFRNCECVHHHECDSE